MKWFQTQFRITQPRCRWCLSLPPPRSDQKAAGINTENTKCWQRLLRRHVNCELQYVRHPRNAHKGLLKFLYDGESECLFRRYSSIPSFLALKMTTSTHGSKLPKESSSLDDCIISSPSHALTFKHRRASLAIMPFGWWTDWRRNRLGKHLSFFVRSHFFPTEVRYCFHCFKLTWISCTKRWSLHVRIARWAPSIDSTTPQIL